MRRISVFLVSVLFLSTSVFAHAVSPDIVRAVAERLVTLKLESGGQVAGEILSLDEATFIVVDTDGEVFEFAYDDVKSVRVRAAAVVEEPVVVAPASPRSAAVEAAEAAARERADRYALPAPAGDLSRAGQTGARREVSYPRVFARMALDLGYGSDSENIKFEGRYAPYKYSARTRGLAVGGNFAFGARVSEEFAVHATFGVNQIFLPSMRTSETENGSTVNGSFESVDSETRKINVGLGFTVFIDGFILSASLGGGQLYIIQPSFGADDISEWGAGGDAMVGFSKQVLQAGRIGVALATTWMVKPRKDAVKWSAYTIGPRFFFSL